MDATVDITEQELREHAPVAVKLLRDFRSAATREEFPRGEVTLVTADDAIGLLREGVVVRAGDDAPLSEPAEKSANGVPRTVAADLLGASPSAWPSCTSNGFPSGHAARTVAAGSQRDRPGRAAGGRGAGRWAADARRIRADCVHGTPGEGIETSR